MTQWAGFPGINYHSAIRAFMAKIMRGVFRILPWAMFGDFYHLIGAPFPVKLQAKVSGILDWLRMIVLEYCYPRFMQLCPIAD